MKFIERIMNFLNKFKTHKTLQALPEAKTDAQRTAFLEKTKVESIQPPKDPTLEECIAEFIKQYSIQKSYNTSDDRIAYSSFISMFCPKEEAGSNKENQNKLNDHIHECGFHASYQFVSNGISYIHFIDADSYFDEYTDFNMEKLYINCPRKDVARLTNIIFDTIKPMQDQGLISKFQLKCVSEQYDELKTLYDDTIKKPTELYQRNEKIVIYSENHTQCMSIADQIGALQSQCPDLFSEIKSVPLIPKANNFVSIAPCFYDKLLTTPLGVTHARTYSDLLAQTMLHSIVSGFDNFHGHGNYTKNTPLMERMSQYADEYVNGFLPKEILDGMISSCKASFFSICQNNEIDTVYTPQNKETEKTNTINDR